MDYTPDTDFDFSGAADYTPDTDFDFAAISGAILTGIGALGTPGAMGSQQFAILTGSGGAGIPQAQGSQQFAILQGQPGAGLPQILFDFRLAAHVLGVHSLGDPEALAHSGYLARMQGEPAAGLPQILGTRGYTGRILGDAGAGAPRVLAFALPAFAEAIPADITYYFATLTGAPDGLADAQLPISSFSVRHRPDGPSYYQMAVPSYAYIGAISARQNGEVVIWSRTGAIEEEVLRGDLGDVRTDRGPNSQTISISGNSVRAETPSKTYLITEALYVSTTLGGEYRLRTPPRAGIRPGDFIRYQDLNFEVGEISWSVAVSVGGMAITMELASLPLA